MNTMAIVHTKSSNVFCHFSFIICFLYNIFALE